MIFSPLELSSQSRDDFLFWENGDAIMTPELATKSKGHSEVSE
jgi:hypothetical protein